MNCMETDKPEVLSHYATKEDLQLVRVEIHTVVGELKALREEMYRLHAQAMAEVHALHDKAMAEIRLLRSDMQGEFNSLRSDVFRALNAQTWKMIGFVLTVNIATVTAVYYIANS